MITSVEVRNRSGAVQAFNLTDDSNGYQVRDISGLDPAAASIVTSTLAEIEGETYQTSTTGKRNIILTLGYSPDYVSSSVESLRENLYDFFIPKSWVQLDFKKDTTTKVFRITGYVETMDAPLFTNDPVATISILCLDPFFINPKAVNLSGSFENETSSTIRLNYEGNAPTGIVFSLTNGVATDQVTLKHTDSHLNVTTFYLDGTRAPFSKLIAGSKVIITSVDRQKDISLNLGGSATTSYLKGIGTDATWIKINKSSRQLVVSVRPTDAPSTYKYQWSLSYYERFSGL